MRYDHVCPECKSSAITVESTSCWDTIKQEWYHVDDEGMIWCNNDKCEYHEIYNVLEVEISEEKNNSSRRKYKNFTNKMSNEFFDWLDECPVMWDLNNSDENSMVYTFMVTEEDEAFRRNEEAYGRNDFNE